MAQQKDSDTHDEIKGFCLDETGPHTLTDPVFSAGTEVLGHIVGNGRHHGVIYQYGELVRFGGSRITGHSGSSETIYHGLHGQLTDAHDGHLKAHGKAGLQVKDSAGLEILEIFPAKMEHREIFESHRQAQYSREELGQDRGPGSSADTHTKGDNKKQIQKNIQDGREDQKI